MNNITRPSIIERICTNIPSCTAVDFISMLKNGVMHAQSYPVENSFVVVSPRNRRELDLLQNFRVVLSGFNTTEKRYNFAWIINFIIVRIYVLTYTQSKTSLAALQVPKSLTNLRRRRNI